MNYRSTKTSQTMSLLSLSSELAASLKKIRLRCSHCLPVSLRSVSLSL
jgi:hypothetical protein